MIARAALANSEKEKKMIGRVFSAAVKTMLNGSAGAMDQ